MLDKQSLYGQLTAITVENTILKQKFDWLLKQVEMNTDRHFHEWCVKKLGEKFGPPKQEPQVQP